MERKTEPGPNVSGHKLVVILVKKCRNQLKWSKEQQNTLGSNVFVNRKSTLHWKSVLTFAEDF